MTDETRDRNETQDKTRTHVPGDHTVSSAGAARTASAGTTIPSQIGDYRIVGILGEGGMGVVYEAEQPSPKRRVALKVVRGGTEVVDELHLKMFAREAETLARLDHPNIGAIYESGHTAEGRHFFAMELVRGQTLGTWLAHRPVDPDRSEIELRLQLFRQICQAVHYAHQRGVIHRDLKPSNLIVTDEAPSAMGSDVTPSPQVKILDFGLARITEEDVALTQITEVGMIKGTLPYMAPEQAAGDVDAIDVRTDVYALGVILYELLTGQRPYSTDTGSLLSAVRVICDQPPRPLAEAWRATVRLDPDLTTITATALEKDPDCRYGSAAAFGDDVARFLSSQPIQARPASTMYQLKKLVSRRKPLFATAAVALLLLVVAAVGMSVLYVRSEANLTRALNAEQTSRMEAETAQRTSDFLVELFDRANPQRTRGETVTARQVIDEGARAVSEELATEPIMQARLMYTIGQVYLSLGLYSDARGLVEKALALRREHLPADDIAIAVSQHQLARTMQALGEVDAARVAFDETIAMYEKSGIADPAGLIETLGNFGWMLGQIGEFDRANATIDRALALVEGQTPPDDELLQQILNNQATVKMNMGQADSAIHILERALQLSRSLHGNLHHQTANVLTNLGIAQARAGHLAAAEQSSIGALSAYRETYKDDHPQVAKALANVGIALAQQGKLIEARPYFQEGIETLTRIHGPEHPEVAQGLMNLGLLKLQLGEPAVAIADLEQAVRLHEGNGGPETPSLSMSLYHLASARAAVGEMAEARRLLLRVVAIDERLFGPESQDVAGDLEALAATERAMGLEADARQSEARMAAILTQLASAESNP
ncbi:MAG: tetratricopeptide repeat protein [candidate division Zixibacteria bacterium]|nr:tetratricopeptide repeat protein [candidate division Zixibacteria bacterium]